MAYPLLKKQLFNQLNRSQKGIIGSPFKNDSRGKPMQHTVWIHTNVENLFCNSFYEQIPVRSTCIFLHASKRAQLSVINQRTLYKHRKRMFSVPGVSTQWQKLPSQIRRMYLQVGPAGKLNFHLNRHCAERPVFHGNFLLLTKIILELAKPALLSTKKTSQSFFYVLAGKSSFLHKNTTFSWALASNLSKGVSFQAHLEEPGN